MLEKYKIIKNSNSNSSRVIYISKNLKYLKFSENINTNNLNILYMIIKKCKEILKILYK